MRPLSVALIFMLAWLHGAQPAIASVKSVTRGITTWQYDYHPTADLLTQETLNIDGLNFAYSYTYTPDGLIDTRANPTGTIIDFMPNGLGQATGIKVGSTNYASGGVYYPNGALQTLNYLNGQSFSAGQNARQLLSSLDVANGTAVAIDNDYLYDARAKITSITDGINAANNRAFTYDALGRLETANGSWGSGSYQYDAVNNLRLKTLGSRTVNIDYSPTTNLVSQVKDTANGNTWKTYTHDARGNVTSNGDINFVYDHANQPQSISGAASGAYIYDGNLKRVKQDVEGKKVYSVYSSLGGGISHRYEVGVDPVTLLPDPANDVRTDFVALGNTTIRLQKTGSASETAVYTHSDHLGSPVVATKADGSIDWREAYTPFGEKLLDPAANRDLSGYTGHIEDDATNLVYMQARYYDPAIGRFLSIDPVTFLGNGGDPRHFNRYAYSYNDPVNMFDADGRKPDHIMDRQMAGVGQACAASAACGAVVEAGTSLSPLGPYMDFANAHANGNGVVKSIGIAALGALNPFKKAEKIGDAAEALGKQGFKKVEIDGDTFVQKTFKTDAGDIDFAAKVGGDTKSLKLDEMQVFPTNGQAPGTAALRQLDGAVTSDLKAAGFKDVTATGTRLSGANEGKVRTVRRKLND